MKKIYNILLIAASLFAFATYANAQSQTDDGQSHTIEDVLGTTLVFPNDILADTDPLKNKYTVKNNVAFRKEVAEPLSNGTYWIKLETFAKGAASISESNTPSDIVLVLDYSNSMEYADYPIDNTDDQYFVARDFQGYTSQNITSLRLYNTSRNAHSFYYYKHSDGKYYPLKAFTSGLRSLYFVADDGVTYYLNNRTGRNSYDTTIGPWTHRPTTEDGVYNTTSNTGAVWQGVLYTTTTRRIDALKAAVSDFIHVIWLNDNFDENNTRRDAPLTNRISVVAFNANNDNLQPLVDWTYVSKNDRSENTSIAQTVTGHDPSSGTYSNQGMKAGNTLLDDIKINVDKDTSRWNNSSRTVVLFTDGIPGSNANDWSEGGATEVANECIAAAEVAKTTYDATVFTVALYDWPDNWDDYTETNSTREKSMRNYMNLVSSNYRGVESLPSSVDAIHTDTAYDSTFFKLAGDNLAEVFKDIARQSGGSSNKQLNSATTAVDIVSSSFMFPEGTTVNDIHIFTAKCKTADPDNNIYTFYPEVEIKHSLDRYNIVNDKGVVIGDADVDNAIVPNFSATDRKISVTGFDYGSNWCGPMTQSGTTTVQGHKVIILIPIKMNPDAIGGPNVQTNASGSGILLEGETTPSITFDTPTVSLPVNLYIEKVWPQANTGESAKFIIDRAVIPDVKPYNYDDLDWSNVSSVFVTNGSHAKISSDGNPMIKVRGLPATVAVEEIVDGVTKKVQKGVVYRITEEDWSWSYTIDPEPKYTDTQKVDNPFTFTNTKEKDVDQKVRHAESKVTNIFQAGVDNKVWDDSKENDRTPKKQ